MVKWLIVFLLAMEPFNHLAILPISLNLEQIRKQFPILHQKINGHQLVYLDSAATSQKPQVVIDEIKKYYEEYNSNIHRSIHTLADRATEAFENARLTAAKFINAAPNEIIFVRNTNEGINLVANGVGELTNLRIYESTNKKKLTIITTISEHHANFVPWLRLQNEEKANIEYILTNKEGILDLNWLENYVESHKNLPLLITLAHVSNVLGNINPIKKICEISHKHNALVLVDAAQSAAHLPLDVKDIGCDFLVFSGHKVFGPTGTSVLYGKEKLLAKLPPFLVGSSMIENVSTHGYTVQPAPHKFEVGTPDICGSIGLGAALKWLSQFSFAEIRNHELKLLELAYDGLSKIDGIKILGTREIENRSGLISFYFPGIHPHDISDLLDKNGIALRSGHHCAIPLHKKLGINATTRLSISIFNTEEEIKYSVKTLKEVVKYLKK